jgi:hypothetical protein
MVRRTLVSMVAAGVCLACATGGSGQNPPLPGGPSGGDDSSFEEVDAAQTNRVDDASSPDDAGQPSDSDGAASQAGMCNDILHGLAALGESLLGQTAATCASSSDCSAGQCCYVSATASACVKH